MSSQGGGPPRIADGRISHSLTAGEPRVIALGLTTLTHAFFQPLNLGYYVSFEHLAIKFSQKQSDSRIALGHNPGSYNLI